MKKSISYILIVALALSVFSISAFAVDSPTPSVTIQYNYFVDGNTTNSSFSVNSSKSSDEFTFEYSNFKRVSFTSGTVVVDNSSTSTSSFTLYPVSSDFSVSTSTTGFSVSKTVSGQSAVIIVSADSSRSSNLCGLTFSSTSSGTSIDSVSCSGYSYTSSGSSGGGDEPENPHAGTGSMFGWTGKTIFGLQTRQMEKWFTDGSGSDRVGHLDATYDYGDAIGVPGYFVRNSMIASLTVQKWQWKISEKTGLPSFNVDENFQGTWSDMIYRTSVYNYFWANKLWSNDVSGSWYGSISSDFSYLNYRVNQILQVLANDEDLQIKEATNSERQWVQDYFEGSGDKADSSKYDDLNNTGSAFKDVFEGAPDTSIADGFSAVNDNGYDFWSQSVSDDINGGASVSTYSDDPSQRIVDAYSENWAQIVGGYYD